MTTTESLIHMPLFSLNNKTTKELFDIAEGGPAGFYPVGVNRFWHGGIHLHGNQPLRAMWDGEILAYRISDKRLTAMIEDKEQAFSHGFVLLRHTYETPKGAQIKFYSLTMHLLPLGEYSAAQLVIAPSIFHQKRYTVKSGTDYALALCDTLDSSIVLGYITHGTAFEAIVDPAFHGEWHRVNHHGIEGCVDLGRKRAHKIAANKYTATPAKSNTNAREQGINLRDADTSGKIIAFAPKGAELRFKDQSAHDKNFLKTGSYRELDAGEIFVYASLETFGVHDVVAPIEYDRVVNLNPPLRVRAGDLLGYTGPYFNREAVAHVEIFTDTVGFLDNPKQETWGKKEGVPNAYAWPDFKRIEDPGGYSQDGFVDVQALVAQLDANKDGNITAEEIKAAMRNPQTAEQLRHLVCLHPTEWSTAGLDSKFARLKDAPWKLKEIQYQQHLAHIKQLTFWEQVTQKPTSSTVWHFHPVAFIKNLKSMMGITKDQLRAIMPGITDENIDNYLLPLNETMEKYGINENRLRQCHFLAQVGHESGSLSIASERYNGTSANVYFTNKYENTTAGASIGNTQPGDGPRFRGRGLIQVTGRENYTNYLVKFKNEQLTDTVIETLANDPKWACDSAAWFWAKGNPAHVNLNTYADQDTDKVDAFDISEKISKVINKYDTHALGTRKARTKLAKKILLG